MVPVAAAPNNTQTSKLSFAGLLTKSNLYLKDTLYLTPFSILYIGSLSNIVGEVPLERPALPVGLTSKLYKFGS